METIKRDVAWKLNYINYQDFIKQASEGKLQESEIEEFIEDYSKAVKRPLQREIDSLNSEISELKNLY